MTAPAHVLLVHGAWHTPKVWGRTLAALAERGVAASAVALPSCGGKRGNPAGLLEDAAAVSAAAAKLAGPVVVCGHSYGGMAISSGEYGAQVKGLIYLCAFMPEAGMSLVAHFPSVPAYAQVEPDGSVVFTRSMAREVLYNDLSEQDAAAAADQLVLHTAAAVTTPAPRAAWKQLRSLYVVCTEDHTIPVDTQRMFSKRATRVVDLPTSHSPMLSAPDRVAELLEGEAGRP